MSDLQRVLVDTLAGAADDEVHIESLLAGARRDGARYRRRRRLRAAVGAAVSIALVVGGITAVGLQWQQRRQHGPGPATGSSVSDGPVLPSVSATPSVATIDMPALPVVRDAVTALKAPQKVGTGSLFHLTLAKLPYPAVTVQWHTGESKEWLAVTGAAKSDGTTPGFTVQLGRTVADFVPLRGKQTTVRVGDKPGTLAVDSVDGQPFTVLRWEPVSGLYVEVSGGMDARTTESIATELRLDSVYSCVVPFRLTRVPPGVSISNCGNIFQQGTPKGSVSITVERWTVTVGAMSGTMEEPPNTQVGGHPASVSEEAGDSGRQILQVKVDYGNGHLADFTAEGMYNKAQVLQIAESYQPVDGTDLKTWSTDPLA